MTLCRPPEVSDLPFYLPNLPDEIRPLVILRHRCRNARRLAGLDAPEHPRQVAAQVAHDLQALLVGENLLGLAAVVLVHEIAEVVVILNGLRAAQTRKTSA